MLRDYEPFIRTMEEADDGKGVLEHWGSLVLFSSSSRSDPSPTWVLLLVFIDTVPCAAVLLCSMTSSHPGIQALWLSEPLVTQHMGFDKADTLITLLSPRKPHTLALEKGREKDAGSIFHSHSV